MKARDESNSHHDLGERLGREALRYSRVAPVIDLSALPQRESSVLVPRPRWGMRLAVAAVLGVLFGHAPHEAAGIATTPPLAQQPRVEREVREFYWSALRLRGAQGQRAEWSAFAENVETAIGPAQGLLQSLGAILSE